MPVAVQFSRDLPSPLAEVTRVAALPRSVDPIPLLRPAQSAHGPFSRVGRYALPAQLDGKLRPPRAKRRSLDIQPPPLLAHRLEHEVHVRMRLIGMEHQGRPSRSTRPCPWRGAV
jgi:hypothetical protein